MGSHKKVSLTIPPLPASTSSVSDIPSTGVSVLSARHFELPIVEEDENEKGEDGSQTKKSKDILKTGTPTQGEQLDDDVFSPLKKKDLRVILSPKSHASHQLVHASTQTLKEDDSEWLRIRKDELYQFVPLPSSNATTPTASQSSLENS